MHLLVWGASYCPYTQALWPILEKLPHVYIPFREPMDKELYWATLKARLNKKHMTFPTIVVIGKDGEIREVKVVGGKLQTIAGKQLSTKDLNVPKPRQPFRIASNPQEFRSAVLGGKVFVNKPS